MKKNELKNKWLKVKKTYKKYSNILAFLFYVFLVAVVIFGLNRGVYDGFAAPVPYIIMLIFITMAFIRLYNWIMRPENEKKKDSDDTDSKIK